MMTPYTVLQTSSRGVGCVRLSDNAAKTVVLISTKKLKDENPNDTVRLQKILIL